MGDREAAAGRGAVRDAAAGDRAMGDPAAPPTAVGDPAAPPWRREIAPVCVGVAGRAGIGRSTLVDALVRRMAGRGPLTVGELPACNDPRRGERATAGAAAPGDGVPVDIVVHMVLGAPAPSDEAAMAAQAGRGVPVLMVRGRVDEHPGACGGLGVAFPPGAPPAGVGALVECLGAGIGRILAARVDAMLAAARRAALTGPDREEAERFLRSAAARDLRAAGLRNWEEGDGTAAAALREAERFRARAVAGARPQDGPMQWHLRYADRAVALGAPVREPADA